jgi:hypothetical protein
MALSKLILPAGGYRATEKISTKSIESNRLIKEGSKIESIANKLAMKFQDPEGLGFYIKVAREHTEYEIDQAVEKALKYGRKPAAYFNRIINGK